MSNVVVTTKGWYLGYLRKCFTQSPGQQEAAAFNAKPYLQTLGP